MKHMQNCAQKCQQVWQNIQQVLVKICEKVVKHVENIQVDLYEIQRVNIFDTLGNVLLSSTVVHGDNISS